MHTVVIEHVRVGDLPEAWRAQLPASIEMRVTVRIDEEANQQADNIENNPLFGMWRDHEDMTDVEAYIDRLRAPRFKREEK